MFWLAYNADKRGITLDLEAGQGRELLKKLAETADVIIESYPPGHMKKLGLDYQALSGINRRIILVSITPFGQKGPYSTFKGPDIVVMAMGGFMAICGDPDRPPLRIGFPQAYLFAAADAAVGALIAYYYRLESGMGQHVDISAQHSASWSAGKTPAFWTMLRQTPGRSGQFRIGLSMASRQRHIWQCKDGFVSFQIFGGSFGAKTNEALVRWMHTEGMATDLLMELDWATFDMAVVDDTLMARIEEPIGKFFAAHTNAELEQGALERGIILFPVSSIGDVTRNPQLEARHFWIETGHPEWSRTLKCPGPWAKTSTAEVKMSGRASLLDEYNEQVYLQELGLSHGEYARLRSAGVV